MGPQGVRRVARLALTVALVVWVTVEAVGQVPADRYATCREQLRRAPREYESAYCFYRVTLEHRLWSDGERLFEELIAGDPGNAWLVLAYGHVHRTRDPARAEALYRRAAAAFQQAGDVAGEVETRTNLANFLRPKGRAQEARHEADRVVALAGRSDDPLVKSQAWILEATHVQETGGDLGVAYRLLKRAQDILPADPPYLRERVLLIALGAAAFRMGRLDEALTTYRRLEQLALARGEGLVLANARFNLLNTSEAMASVLPTPGARNHLAQMAQLSLATAMEAQHLSATLKSHRLLADLFAADAASRTRALEHARQCLSMAETARQPGDEAACAWIVAGLLAPDDAHQSEAAMQRARDATARDRNPRTQAHSAGRQMRLSWLTRPREDAVRDSLAAIDTIETLRALQEDGRSSADLFSAWTLDYYWLSGRLLQDDGRDEALAFAITERMRARSLLDALDRARRPLDSAHPAVAARRTALEGIAAVQRVLMDPTLDDPRRATLLRELDVLERREQDATRNVALAFPDRRNVARTFASLDAIQAALAPDEALLSFQVGLWETYAGENGGGSWLIAVTRQARSVYRLPDRAGLSHAIPMFNGLLAGSEQVSATAAVSLYQALVAEAIASLPTDVTRLVIVPDGALHQLPFEALRSARDAPPLGTRYAVVIAPSATLWLQWRTHPPPSPAGRLLTVADPAIAGSDGDAATREATLSRGIRLGRLPYARDESRAIARHVGSVDVLIGANATERAVKSRHLRRYDVLHIAAHAVADDTYPERSAVILAPGDHTEDGLLQAREIAALDLEGRIVVLSACQTAAGAILSGEGVLSLARAFFEAGAHAVIGTRWPLRDEDGAVLFEMFYRHLAEGASLSDALRATREEARMAGRPASAWAGLVVIGNGELRPLAARRAPATSWHQHLAPLATTLAILAVVGIALSRYRL